KSSKYINAIFDVYGKDVVKNLKEFKYEDETMDFIKIHGFLGDPSIARSTPLSSSLFVNNRYVTSPLIQKAMQEAYKDYIMVKKYPFYILFLYIKPDTVDFNIHPTKKIIRFANEQKLLSTLVNILKKEVEEKFGQSQSKIKSIGQLREAENVLTDSKDILESHGTTLHGGRLPLKKEIALIREGSKRTGVRSWQKEFRVLKGSGSSSGSGAGDPNHIIKTEIVNDKNIKEGKFGKPQSTTHELRLDRMYNIDIEGVPIGEEGGNEIATSGNKGTLKNRGPSDANSGTGTAATMTLKSGLYPETLSPQKISLIRNQYIDTNGVFPKMRLINEAGQLNKLYIIFEGEDGFFILDQHAAAERIRYEEELNAYKSGKLEKQALLLPIMIEVPPNETEFIKANLKELEKFGFRLDFMGGNSFAVRSVPVVFGRIEDKEIIKDICLEIVSMGKEDSFSDEVDKIIKYIACHRSLRGGAEITNPIKSINLLKRLAQCENPHHCAHGRPTMLFITWDELEKLFHRK
ncbi:MAG: DNA mismatch repair endonuclease MutL, partial [Promethearchaeota archaeon]